MYEINGIRFYIIVLSFQIRSRKPKKIIDEVKKLTEEGIKEITLLGQNVNSYGHDLEIDFNFAQLLKKIDQIDNLKRIRYMTSHPRDFSKELVVTVKGSQKVCEHFHLPIQSGSSRILKKMNRGYTREHYLDIVNSIEKNIPEASITTDIIVGFPGETEKEFQETLDLVKKVEFDMAFTFSYSPREGTPAAEMDSQIPEEIKDKRLQKLMDIQNKISLEQNQKLKGQTLKVLIEGESKNNPDTFKSRSRTNKLVIIPRKDKLLHKVVNVKINKVQSWTLYGEVQN